MAEYGLSEIDAIRALYTSQLYRLLAIEATKLWHYSVHALLEIFKVEQASGDISNSTYLYELAGRAYE
jgi:hypothetical protein